MDARLECKNVPDLTRVQMVAGMGGLSQGFLDLADGEDRAQMMNPAAIMGNLEHGNMLMGP